MSEGPTDRELLEMSEHNTAVMADRFNKLAQQLRDVAIMGQLGELERRDKALHHAVNLTRAATNLYAVNHTSVLAIAAEFDAWLKDGTMPDMIAEYKEISKFVQNHLQGMFPADIINKANNG